MEERQTTISAQAASCEAVVVRGLCVDAGEDGARSSLLTSVSFDIPRGHFAAVIGPSGCGKSTLIRSIAGIQQISQGAIHLAGHPVDLLQHELPLAIGYLGQFGAFHTALSVRENLETAVALRLPKSVSKSIKSDWVRHITQLAGIEHILDQPYSTLSGGQMRRVALAEELIGDPQFLILDELTSGLDEYSDQEMMLWLRDLAHQHGKTILLVTHATYHLNLCDSILFLHSGRLIQHGSLENILSVHQVSSTAELLGLYRNGLDADRHLSLPRSAPPEGTNSEPIPLKSGKPPNGFRQLPILVARQFRLFVRDRAQLWMTLALIVIFPAIVAVFATTGLPQVRNLTLSLETNVLRTLQEGLLYMQESFRAAALISGLAMFQVVLLTLMGANNSAREIAKERAILEKELRTGLSPVAYVFSKFLQVTLLSAIQAFWMTWFVRTICGFPGSASSQFWILFATTLAMSSVCLAISASAKSPERASLLSIYLVGFQMPLSGAALSLPIWLSDLCRPFIAAYWGWSGYLMTLQNTRHYDIVKQSTRTTISSYPVCISVLLLHIVVGVCVAIYFVRRKSVT